MLAVSGQRRLVGRCPIFFLMAVGFDLSGFALILLGVFADLQLDGRSFGEFIIYGGGILLFFSLLWWLAWYSFNLEVSMEDLLQDQPAPVPSKTNLVQLARKLSERLSQRARRKLAAGTLPIGGSPMPNPQPGPGPGPLNPFVFTNNGLESPSMGPKQLELSTVSSLCVQLEVAGVPGMVDRLI